MFNNDSAYNVHDIDLLQPVQKPIIEIVYEPQNLDYISWTTETDFDKEMTLI